MINVIDLLFFFFLKAIEEIDISDKAVAAAVNEVIECNTNVSPSIVDFLFW